MIVVLNEWVFHDLLGDNGAESQRETASFLNALFSSSDMLVVPAETRWMRKAYQLMTLTDSQLRSTSLQFHTLIRDLDRARYAQMEHQDPVPEELLARTPDEDIYLVSAYLSANADTLVTTDTDLHDALSDSDLVSCRMRDEFLANYLR